MHVKTIHSTIEPPITATSPQQPLFFVPADSPHIDSYQKGSFSNDDGNKNVKKAIGLISKTTTLHVVTLLCTFLYRPCMTTT